MVVVAEQVEGVKLFLVGYHIIFLLVEPFQIALVSFDDGFLGLLPHDLWMLLIAGNYMLQISD